ncbi:MAG: acyl-CoA synthetase [Proteobacteria bacterium]|nr:acyl-CoA synthetase [Pseudomonadota bacterium]
MEREDGRGRGRIDIFEAGLERGPANWTPLTPLSFLARAADVFPAKTAVIHGETRLTWAEFAGRARRLASALARRGIGRGDTVSVLAPNVPAMLEAHYGVPMAGAVLNALNFRLDAASIAFILAHAESRLLIVDREFAEVARRALSQVERRPEVVEVADPLAPEAEPLGGTDYEDFLAEGDAGFEPAAPADEWQAITLNYTSGTTGNPKGVVYHHRGAYLNALSNALAFGLDPASVYLWTLPMFHCNGWTYTWAVTAVGGTHVCLRRVEPAAVFAAIEAHGVTHLCGAPVVLTMLIHAREAAGFRPGRTVEVATGGAAPPSAVIAAMERMGMRITHLYGLTESFGPSMLCEWQAEWDGLDLPGRAGRMARQGVRTLSVTALRVADPATLAPVPADGKTIGEILLRSNTIMKGYLKNPSATAEAFRGGWFHTGDLAVMHADGYAEIKDRAKDIIISGGENISSLEVEEALYKHPRIMEAAVVARPDETWGESPCAFVTPKEGADPLGAEEVIAWCREHLARFKVPRTVVFGPLPKTATGKIQKYVLRERAREMGPLARARE